MIDRASDMRHILSQIQNIQTGQPLAEAIVPAEMLAPRYFHGSQARHAKSILAHGLYPSDFVANGRANTALRPVEGRVYMSPDATAAALYGEYLFVIYRENLIGDLIPDEDKVGEIYSMVASKYMNDLDAAAEIWGADNPHTEMYRTLSDPENIGKARAFRAFMEKVLTPNTLSKMREGEYIWWAKGGKTALKKMPTDLVYWLIGLGVHVSHQGRIIPDEAWKITDREKLLPDGSNLAQVAERVDIDHAGITDMPPKGPPLKWIGTTEYNKNWANPNKPVVPAYSKHKLTAPTEEEAVAELERIIGRSPHKIVSVVRA